MDWKVSGGGVSAGMAARRPDAIHAGPPPTRPDESIAKWPAGLCLPLM